MMAGFSYMPADQTSKFFIYMNTENKQRLYVSPEAEVIEVEAQQVICQSQQQLGEENDGAWS